MTRDYFKDCMSMVVAPGGGDHLIDGESFAISQLVIATTSSMTVSLKEAQEKGKSKWWDKESCDISTLYDLRDIAIKEKRHIDVINFTSMIAMRESV